VTAPGPELPADPLDLLRERSYVVVLVFGAVMGAPIAFVAYWFLQLVSVLERWVYGTLPLDLGFSAPPVWWPIPVLLVAGVIVGLAITYLPGTGGHSPAQGFATGAPPTGAELPAVVIAAIASLALGAVVGPEAPLIAIGGGLALLIVHLLKKDAPAQAAAVIGAAGSFAAISTILGSPLVGAFLLMEVAGLAGPMMGIMLLPGLLAAGIGSLVFLGIDSLTGYGTFALAVPDLPPFTHLNGYEFAWAIGIGVLGALAGTAILRIGRFLEPIVAGRRLVLTPLAGVAVGVGAVIYAQVTGNGSQQVLFSGQEAMTPLIQQAATFTVGALVLLVVCKSLTYGVSLASFRGGPTFPALFIGAAGGIALSHLPGLPMVAGVAMGIGAMSVTILRLPLTSVLLTVIFLASDGLVLTPLVIVAVVVAYVCAVRLTPRSSPAASDPTPSADAAPPATA
jgi:H+/Cl- antiporter ClcA